tara:strand:- start:342 stop:599 length:258 start_codon:yes stop_codon:yes gene_type:complete
MNNKLHHINEVEIYELALHQLELKANRVARKNNKASRDELNFINAQRKDIASQLYHSHKVQRNELYLATHASDSVKIFTWEEDRV